MLVSELGPGLFNEFHDCAVVYEYLTLETWAPDHLTRTVVHDLGSQVLAPTTVTKQVATVQRCHHLKQKCRYIRGIYYHFEFEKAEFLSAFSLGENFSHTC